MLTLTAVPSCYLTISIMLFYGTPNMGQGCVFCSTNSRCYFSSTKTSSSVLRTDTTMNEWMAFSYTMQKKQPLRLEIITLCACTTPVQRNTHWHCRKCIVFVRWFEWVQFTPLFEKPQHSLNRIIQSSQLEPATPTSTALRWREPRPCARAPQPSSALCSRFHPSLYNC